MKRMVKMSLIKETKGALRYEGMDDDAPGASNYMIGTLYLRKDAIAKEPGVTGFPQTIFVTVEGGGGEGR